MTTYFRDFSSGDGISDFTELAHVSGSNAPSWAIQNTDEVIATSASAHLETLAWNDIDGDANRATVEVVGMFKCHVLTGSTSSRVFSTRVSSDSSRTAYSVRLRTSDVYVYRSSGVTATQLGGDTTVSLTVGNWYWVRFQFSGSAYKLRVWLDGGSEPGTWNVEGTDSTYSTAGSVGLCKGANTIAHEWSMFGVGTNGDTAPSSGGSAGYTLTVTAGSYAVTGQSVDLRAGLKLAATQGSYALTGQSVGLQAGRELAATAGAYALSGQSVNLRAGRQLGVTQGSYSLNGQSVTLTYGGAPAGYTLVATQGAYALTGQSVGLRAVALCGGH